MPPGKWSGARQLRARTGNLRRASPLQASAPPSRSETAKTPMEGTVFEDHELSIPCPQCGHETKKTIGWLKSNSEFTSAGCESMININADELFSGLDKVEKSLSDFKDTLRKL